MESNTRRTRQVRVGKIISFIFILDLGAPDMATAAVDIQVVVSWRWAWDVWMSLR